MIHPADPKINRRDLGSVIRATFLGRLFLNSPNIDRWNSFLGARVTQPCEWKGVAKSHRSRRGLEKFLMGDGERIARDTIEAVLAEEVLRCHQGNHVQSNKEPSKRTSARTRVGTFHEVEQGLFQDVAASAEEDEFAPPHGPVVIGLKELIQLTEAKRARPRLSERRIQVMGRRMEKFVPPIWRGNRRKEQIYPCGMHAWEDRGRGQVGESSDECGRTNASDVATWKRHNDGEEQLSWTP
jgi:hypothetical protein